MRRLISFIVPAHNEEQNIPLVYANLKKVLQGSEYNYELIFVDDGSTDKTSEKANEIIRRDKRVRLIRFSRNFGKEASTSCGIHASKGDAVMMIDADLQHPPEIIPEFIKKWEEGAQVVIGVRKENKSGNNFKKFCSGFFYIIINTISDTNIVPQATDFRLIDRIVVDEFNRLTERNRITRGLIDWLGFKRDFIYFDANGRKFGKEAYSFIKLIQLAVFSITTHSYFPLKLAGYLGIVIVALSAPLGLFIFIEKYVLHDPHHYNFSGSAILAVILLFLVGIVLICLGLMALYIANIQNEVINRPMYVVKKDVCDQE